MTAIQELQRLIADRHGVHPRECTPDSTLLSLGIDSLATLELLLDIEEAFGIAVSDATPRLVTVGDLASLIERQRSLQPHAP